ncbi:hypothetical protein LX87_00744 [Larkinella arboricola]|uniref:Uncharacterized protein n=1 Tax=Larkinella arboricola TaxID=643671 RepID=A0A327X962_LARAB|nr:hypothetical protein [Larkinella arboricola]RAK02624.1 hypothetical protein LX87_00744 [Larkinella arboricola]
MATTDEEWERLFRQRFENYKSEPDEDALEHILSHVKPVSAGKSSARWKKRLGSGLVALGILALLLFSLWQYLLPTAADRSKLPTGISARSTKNTNPAEVPSTYRVTDPAALTAEKRLSRERAEVVGEPSDQRVAMNRRTVLRCLLAPEIIPDIPAGENIVSALSSTAHPISEPERTWAQPDFGPIVARPVHAPLLMAALPNVRISSTDHTPTVEPDRPGIKPSFFTSVMPLYTFRQLTPSRQDEIVMEKIRPATALSARTGWRVQAGAEWALSRTFGLRVGVVYQQLQQQLTYTARALRSDSSKVEWIDPQTMKVTPLYRSQEHQVKTTWQYAAISAEGRLQLNPGKAGLRHYLAAGGSLGFLISGRSRQNWQPIAQASYGIERQLTQQVRLQVEPGIVYNLRSISDNSRCFSVRPYSYGLVIGLHWQPSI